MRAVSHDMHVMLYTRADVRLNPQYLLVNYENIHVIVVQGHPAMCISSEIHSRACTKQVLTRCDHTARKGLESCEHLN